MKVEIKARIMQTVPRCVKSGDWRQRERNPGVFVASSSEEQMLADISVNSSIH